MHNPAESTMPSLRRRVNVTEAEEVYFPDEIMANIISRLPTKTALRCRCVCKRWRDLTLTPDFLELFLRRSPPVIVFQKNHQNYHGSHIYFIDNWWKPGESQAIQQELPEGSIYDGSILRFSHDGLIVFRENYTTNNYIVQNPIYDEYVKISFPKEGCVIYGVFFHPFLKEYCMLWRQSVSRKGQYMMVNLGPNPCWKRISNPWEDKYMASTCSVLVNGYLYWIVHSCAGFEIMEFDINNEVFNLIPRPDPDSQIRVDNLLNIDNSVSFVKICRTKESVHMNIWTLQDHGKKSWKNRSYNITLKLGVSHLYIKLKSLAVREGELFILVNEDLFAFNIELGTTRKLVKNNFTFPSSFFVHSMSLASLKNCKSIIYMNNLDCLDNED